MKSILEWIGIVAVVVISIKIVWTTWAWVLEINNFMGAVKRFMDKIILRVTNLENKK